MTRFMGCMGFCELLVVTEVCKAKVAVCIVGKKRELAVGDEGNKNGPSGCCSGSGGLGLVRLEL
jgi:hypothetical protein